MSLDNSPKAVSNFIKGNRIYIFMLAVIIAVNLLSIQGVLHKEETEAVGQKKISRIMDKEEMLAREKRIKEILEEKKFLAITLKASLFLLALALAAGLILSIRCLALRLNGRNLMAAYGSPPDVNWDLLDILKVVIIFYFFGYALQLFEIMGFYLLDIKEPDERIAAVLNTTLMDILGFSAVLYFVIKKYKRTLVDLGIFFKNLLRDIKIGFIAYVTVLPVLFLVIIFVFVILQLVKYEPPSVPLFELFYEESRPTLLFVLTILVTFLGPIAEEVFFRGFAYPVLRRRLGIRNAIILISFVFALLHTNLIGLLPILALGILLAYLYEKTGSLIPSITVHMIHNLIIVYWVHLYKTVVISTSSIY